MAINRVDYGNTTLIDLTDTTATASDVANGKYFYGVDGVRTLGTGAATGLVILSYGNSTWAEFEAAYNTNSIVYCRASSNANPASGSQTRLAFMAYVNNETNPTNVEFQYYRSVSSHSDSQQGDQVFVYKLDKTDGWTVTTRNAFTKIAAGTGLSSSYASQTLTLSSNDVVHVGADAPSDSNVKIWLDTDEPGMSAVSSVNGATGTVVLDADDVGAMSEWDLLWENASPTSAFSAQTIPLDLSDYDAIVITSKHWADNDARRNEIAFVGATRMILTVQSPTNIKIQTLRLYSVSTTGVTFEGGKGTNDSLATYDSNYASIPLAIYGVKGVQTS